MSAYLLGDIVQPTLAVSWLSRHWACSARDQPRVVTPGALTQLCPLQVLERWCTSPRTIEVLMNTYSVVKLPEDAVGLVPPETLQVRFSDPEHTVIQPAPRDVQLLKGSPLGPSILPPQKLLRKRKLRVNT